MGLSLAVVRLAVGFCALLFGATTADAASVTDGEVRPASAFVRLEAFSWGRPTGTGNAVAIAPNRLLTACHVIAGSETITAFRGDQQWPVQLLEAVPQADLCVLDSPAERELQPIITAASPASGPLTAVAFWPDHSGPTLTKGESKGLLTVSGQPLLLTDMPFLPGMSGGGVFDQNGALVGIVVGRWHHPSVGVAVSLNALAQRQPLKSASSLSTLPSFVDESAVWPDMLSFGLSQVGSGGAARSMVSDGWHITRTARACMAIVRDAEQADLGLSLEFTAGDPAAGAPARVHLAIEQQKIPFSIATRPLTLTVLPQQKQITLRPARLLQGPDDVEKNLWSVRWERDDARDLLPLLPAADGFIFSAGRRDLGALPVQSQSLWDGLRQVCL